MSLLLEALKKAEQAKQSGAAQQPGSSAPPADGLSLAPTALPAAEPAPGEASERPLITRDRLPDITQTLEILSDDLPSASGQTGREAGLDAPSAASPPFERGRAGAAAGRARDDLEKHQADREAARQLFEAKPMDYDPRRPFKITLAALGVVAIGIVVYFWWQTQPRSLQVVQRPPAQPPATQIAAAPVSKAPAPVSAAPPEPALPPPTATLPEASPAAAPAAPSAPETTVPAPPRTVPAPRPSTPPRATGATREPPTGPEVRAAAAPPAASAARPGADISVTRSTAPINAALAGGYAAFQSGDLVAARREYERALAADPRNRDALLGLAAVDIRVQRFESAEARYLRVLDIDPRDPDANAGMVSLRGHANPVQSESRLKTLLAAQPEAASLYYALGNQYAVQARWAEAQQVYFRAASIEPENPDYTFNLAVSLDHLRQAKPALEHYQRALALAGSRVASFNKSQVEIRIRELQR